MASPRTASLPASYRNHHFQHHSSSPASKSVNSDVPISNHRPSHRSKPLPSRRSVSSAIRSNASLLHDDDNDSGRVRVSVRVRPKNVADLSLDADFADCVDLQPELRRLKLKKNNWNFESYRFDEIFAETASQKRVYETVGKPVVESVLSGYNGTIMAYGQTGTGKTYTVGNLGKNDASERGVMVRAVEDIIANISLDADVVEVSYLQLYMESIQDLLAPEKVNIHLNEDSKTGEVSLPGVTRVQVRDLDRFSELLQIGDTNRHTANTNQNTESSRSHAILMVYLRRSIHQKAEDDIPPQDRKTDAHGSNGRPRVRKSKLLIVDLAGSERVDKSGSEGQLLEEAKFINLSLTSLGKCINALAENSSHIPTRDSKLTRLLRDSFGGTARTSLIITIASSLRHHAETSSTIMFGQRAMKIVNMVKLKEEFDYESLCWKLETQVDHLTEEVERERKLRQNEKSDLEEQLKGCQASLAEMKKKIAPRSEFLEKEKVRLELEIKNLLDELGNQKVQNDIFSDKLELLEMRFKDSQQQLLENSTYQKVLADTTQMYEMKISELSKQLEDDNRRCESTEEELNLMKDIITNGQETIKQHEEECSTLQKALKDTIQMYDQKIAELNNQLEDERVHTTRVEEQLNLNKMLVIDSQNLVQEHEVDSIYQRALAETTQLYEQKITELHKNLADEHARYEAVKEQLDQGNKLDLDEIEELREGLQAMYQLHESTQTELQSLKSENDKLLQEKEILKGELSDLHRRLLVEEMQRKSIEHGMNKLKKGALENDNDFQDKKCYSKQHSSKLYKPNPSKEALTSQKVTIAQICEEVGLQKILQLVTSEDSSVQIHAVKVIANLAAEDDNQEKIVEEGGLNALLTLLKSSENATILRVASGAIANLAMNELNQGLIMSKGGADLLAKLASKTDDPQTLRMVAGALANLCGNEILHTMLNEDGGIKALLQIARSKSSDVVAQVARGMANFAKCESRGTLEGRRKGRSLLMEEGALEWLITNSGTSSSSTRRHIELAICHLAQNDENTEDFIGSGGVKELVRISNESSREDIRHLARKTLNLNPKFRAAVQQ
ncbi:Kinesin-like protein KIN-UC [Euphorbia peplus]|nr:Kinesin-like protein KIN-UC [Euphorbia peplus]